MNFRHSLTTALIAAGLITPVAALAAPRSVTVKEEVLGEVTVLAPAEEPQSFVALLSDKDGVTAAMQAIAERLVAGGAAVALIDSPRFIELLDKSDEEDCHYAFGDIEDAARLAQRELGMKNWRWPVLLGLGDTGGGLAYLSIAQTPDNTAAGAVSTGMSAVLPSHLALCPGAVGKSIGKDLWTYAPPASIPARWAYVTTGEVSADARPFFDAAKTQATLVQPDSGEDVTSAAIRTAIVFGAPPTAELADLPLVELPTDRPPVGLAILISGDGGWRDIDKSIGEVLQKDGVAVVGIDALRYFWSTKDPQTVANDLTRIMAYYSKAWGTKRAAIMGYSLGADVIPFAWGKITPEAQKKVNLLVMMGLEPTADFQVSVTGWLGMASAEDVDVRPLLPGLPMDKTMCFYGEEEVADEDTACTDPALAKATIVRRPGGHHFDGNYELVAQMILARIKASGGAAAK